MAVATEERTGRKLTTATADPAPPGVGEDGYLVRRWDVDGEEVAFSLKPFAAAERHTYWYTGVGAAMWWRSQRINDFGVQPVIQKEAWVDGSFSPRNPWEEHMTRAFLRENHIDPDKSRDERHPEGKSWICGEGFCNFACPSWHVFTAHQRKLGHKSIRTD